MVWRTALPISATFQDRHREIASQAYDSYLNALVDLRNGRLDGVFGDVSAMKNWLKENPDFVIMDERATDPEYYGKGLGIALRKGNPLLAEINQALEKVMASLNTAKLKIAGLNNPADSDRES